MLAHLIPSRRGLSSDDPIFALHGEAEARKAAGDSVVDATVGALLDDSGQLVVLESVMDLWRELTALEVAPYAPITGRSGLPAGPGAAELAGPVGRGCRLRHPGGSGALAVSLRTFLEPGQALLTAAPFWGPYGTFASEAGMRVATAPWPEAGRPLDLAAWRREAEALLAAQGRLLVWLNDPCHNPTGRSLTAADRAGLAALLVELADRGPVTLLLDFAYLDYTREPGEVAAALADYAALGAAGRGAGGGLPVAVQGLHALRRPLRRPGLPLVPGRGTAGGPEHGLPRPLVQLRQGSPVPAPPVDEGRQGPGPPRRRAPPLVRGAGIPRPGPGCGASRGGAGGRALAGRLLRDPGGGGSLR